MLLLRCRKAGRGNPNPMSAFFRYPKNERRKNRCLKNRQDPAELPAVPTLRSRASCTARRTSRRSGGTTTTRQQLSGAIPTSGSRQGAPTCTRTHYALSACVMACTPRPRWSTTSYRTEVTVPSSGMSPTGRASVPHVIMKRPEERTLACGTSIGRGAMGRGGSNL